MNMEKPDKWVIIKITAPSEESTYRVFATWLGGYLDGDAWKINSGITRVEKTDKFLLFHGLSGSVYECSMSPHTYGFSSFTVGVLNNLIENAQKVGHVVEVMKVDTDWMNLINLENEKA